MRSVGLATERSVPKTVLRVLAFFVLLAVTLLVSQAAPKLIRAADAQTATTSITVTDLNGNPVNNFSYVINQDNVGDPSNPNSPPSMRPDQSNSPVVAAGDQSNAQGIDLPTGKYLVSVSADGYKLGGEYFSAGNNVTVSLEPEPSAANGDPSRLGRIQVHAFQDNHLLNGEDDAPLESGLAGFDVKIKDQIGTITQDYFGNPLGTQYEKAANGDFVLDANGDPQPVLDANGDMVVDAPATDANGDAVVENLPPGKYGVEVVPPDGSGWIQTSTLEGTHTIDAWVDEGNDGTITEVLGAGQSPSPMAAIGFVEEKPFASAGGGSISGTVHAERETLSESATPPLGPPVPDPYIGLTDLGNDTLAFLGRGDASGAFNITGVPNGTYQMVIFDEPLDSIINFRTVIVDNGQAINLGDIGVPAWFGQLQGTVFNDNGNDAGGAQISQNAAGNGLRDCSDPNAQSTCEPGLPNVPVATHYEDGSVQYATNTNSAGHYSFDEVFPLGRFTVNEVGSTRSASTGASSHNPLNGNVSQSLDPAALTMAVNTNPGESNNVDWGKQPYTGTQNGGITGVVYYATMRTEENARFQSADDYEPGIPGVTVNLYEAETDPQTGDPLTNSDGSVQRGPFLNSVETDSYNSPTDCQVLDENGDPVTGLTGDRTRIGPECLSVPALGNQVKDALYDGSYAFISDSQGNP